jgi:hypothetical protein
VNGLEELDVFGLQEPDSQGLDNLIIVFHLYMVLERDGTIFRKLSRLDETNKKMQ